MGPFFWRLRRDLERAGARVSKINFCAGDALFHPFGATAYRGALADWPSFLDEAIETKGIDTLVLFGDCRPYHAPARQVAARKGCELVVFEEGYLRPDCITIERGGVNKHSTMSRDPAAYLSREGGALAPETVPVGNVFAHAALYAVCYGLANFLGSLLYPRYRHHRPLNPLTEAFYWGRGLFRKHWFRWREARLMEQFTGPLAHRYFLVPLQVHNDSQITVHSPFASVQEFIGRVVHSFAAAAPADCVLVIKHHPMDRPYRDYSRLVRRLSRESGLDGRVLYVHDLHLPTLLQNARGSVVVNSTAGLSSVFHGTPVVALGDPVYNMTGLTFQGSLDAFWRAPGAVDREFYGRYRAWLLARNQANGSFYRRLAAAGNECGVRWPSDFTENWRGRLSAHGIRLRPFPLSFDPVAAARPGRAA